MLVLAESYLHDLDPFLIQFTETLGLRYYGLAYAAGFVVAWWGVWWFAKTDRSPLDPKGVGDLMTLVIIGTLLGGRLGWAIFYRGGTPLWNFDVENGFPWWELLRITGGGMASHGGMLGVIAVCWWYARRHKVPPMHLFDLGALTCTAGLFLGRLANFINGELWGKQIAAAQQSFNGGDPPWWSIKYPVEVDHWVRSGDVRGDELRDRLQDVVPGDATFVQQIADGLRDGDAAITEVAQPMLTAYYPSQIFQAISDGPILAGLLALIWLRPRKPGVVGCWFLIIYGVLRIVTEIFRQPDDGVDIVWGLQRGQLLSVLMILAGIVILVLVARRDATPLPGLRSPHHDRSDARAEPADPA